MRRIFALYFVFIILILSPVNIVNENIYFVLSYYHHTMILVSSPAGTIVNENIYFIPHHTIIQVLFVIIYHLPEQL